MVASARWGGRGSVQKSGRLADLDQVTVGVADVRADFAPVILGRGQELSAFGRPLLVDLGDVRDAHVEECAGTAGIWWCGEGDAGLIVGGTGSGVEHQPRV